MTEKIPPHLPQAFDKATLITGGSKGIGSGCARVFVRAGANVVICDIDEEAGCTLAAELAAAGPGTCHFEPCDVRRPDQVERVIERAVTHLGRLDCLINNAGQHPPHQPIDGFSVEAFREMLEMNLVSVFAACKYALPHLRKTRGSIINLGSIVGAVGQWQATTYCASKGGVHGLTKALAIDEAEHGVRVNAILPGNILTQSRLDFEASGERPWRTARPFTTLLKPGNGPGAAGRSRRPAISVSSWPVTPPASSPAPSCPSPAASSLARAPK